jgi:two-component system OmpR family response regulator
MRVAERILVVDDEPAINELLVDALRLAQYDPVSASHGMEAFRILREQEIDLAIVDVNMPVMSGYELLERMQEAGITTPVLVLTAREGRDDTRTSFGLGADDFVRKPFGVEEIILRVAAILRRSRVMTEPSIKRVGQISLDDDAHEVRLQDELIELSPTEYRLLSLLMDNTGRVLTKEQLLEQVWGFDRGTESSTVETYVSYLRKKFGDGISIRTVRGVGYQLLTPQAD